MLVEKVDNVLKGFEINPDLIRIFSESVHLKKKDGGTLAVFVKGSAPDIPDLLLSQIKKHCLSRGGKKALKPDFNEAGSSHSRSRKSKLIGNYDVSRNYKLVKALGTNRVCVRTEFDKKYPQTSENIAYWEKLSKLYKTHARSEYNLQKSIFPCPGRIGNSVFTTITANYNWESAVHRDSGNFHTLTCFTVHGDFDGAELCFPDYRVGFRVKENDLLLFDGNEMHGNLPILSGERLSLCCYARKDLTNFKREKYFKGVKYMIK